MGMDADATARTAGEKQGPAYRYSVCRFCHEEIRAEWPYRVGEWMDRETHVTCDNDATPPHEPDGTWRTTPLPEAKP